MGQLIVDNISKHFGQKVAVDKLSFSVEKGKAFCLLGGNGAGKSTTISMLLGFIKPDHGELKFGDNHLWKERHKVREDIFYLPDQVNLYPEFTATENLSYLTKLAGITVSKNDIHKAITEVGLQADEHSKYVSDYSKGMRQKVALALAKLKKPKLLLLDEPTTGLDPIAIKEFVAFINSLKSSGVCVVMVSHDLQCAHLLADEIGILQQGILKKRIVNHELTLDQLEAHYFNSVNE
ncbi:ABC transporter ATP-binding protein [Aliikangiella sp. IMCC44359]|uniref:ABC transporter ATP-binding protein n=1 Tax=Aliikangiella sp. IMCC44359 TaxID=3459125 RepID=UPI00403B2DF6